MAPRLSALLTLALVAAPAAPAQTITWERVGDRPFNASLPSLAPDGTMWSVGSGGVHRLDPPYGSAQTWRGVANFGTLVLALGQDTLVVEHNFSRRSVDNGATFQRIDMLTSVNALVAVPFGLPNGGALVGAARNFAVSSRDRGATWARTTLPDDGSDADALAVVLRGEHAGRVVAAGLWGLATSDDGGATFTPVPGRWGHFRMGGMNVAVAAGAAPGGGDRLVATMQDTEHVPYVECLVVVSDDGGETWRETADLTGDPNAASGAMAAFGGGRVVIVMNGGHVWQSEDAGETWRIVGVVPGALMDPEGSPTNGRVKWALAGPDGRLYVGGTSLGGVRPGWAYRTVGPLAVAGESGPPVETSEASLSVEPNPSSGAVRVSLVLPEAVEAAVAVFDALGRQVAVLHEGAAQGGTLDATFDASALPAGVYVVRAVVHSAGGGVSVLTRTVTAAR